MVNITYKSDCPQCNNPNPTDIYKHLPGFVKLLCKIEKEMATVIPVTIQSVLNQKLDLIVSATYASIPSQTIGTYKMILVLSDETNGNIPTLYFYDGTGLQWLPTSKLY